LPAWRLADRTLPLTEPIGAGIVNVTTDSMFEGARSGTPEQAVADGLLLAERGFDMLDVGAVPARSGPPVSPEEEAARLVPAVAGLSARSGVPVSADTFEPLVAREAARAGAAAINDIGGGEDAMLEAVAETGCGYVLMHIEGPPRRDRPAPKYEDVVERLKEFFAARIERAVALGMDAEAIALDPGLDFDLSVDDDLEIVRRLGELHSLGRPLYVSLSRKDFVGALLAGSWEERLGAGERGSGTTAAASLAAAAGAQVHRLHDISALDAVRVAARIAEAGRPASPLA
jgi:dihydropteroate synthase